MSLDLCLCYQVTGPILGLSSPGENPLWAIHTTCIVSFIHLTSKLKNQYFSQFVRAQNCAMFLGFLSLKSNELCQEKGQLGQAEA